MTENKMDAKSEARELHELSSEELDAVSGGNRIDWIRMCEKALEMM